MVVNANLTQTASSPNPIPDDLYDIHDIEDFMTHEFAFSSFIDIFLQYNDSPDLHCQLEDVTDENGFPSTALIFTRNLPTQDGVSQLRAKYEVRAHNTWGLVLLISLPDHPADEASDLETVYRCLIPKDDELMMRNAGFSGGSAITFIVCLPPSHVS